MKKFLLLAGLLSVLTSGFAAEAKWISLFDGKTLKGWKQLDGQAKFEVVDGTIQGTIVPGQKLNSFLVTEDDSFEDFVFEAEFKVEPGFSQGGTGVQFRSRPADAKTRRVNGYQYEIDQSPRALTAGIQEEGGVWRREGPAAEAKHVAESPTGMPGAFWLSPTKNSGEPAKEWVRVHGDILKTGDWNTMRIEARGPRLRTWLNGQLMADIEDNFEGRIHRGFFGLQVHRTEDPKALGKRVWFRNLRVQRLN
jgi:hypothetical protein